jgi:hypothetical protein
MQRWFSHTIQRLSGTTVKLILLISAFLMLWGILAPINTIVWWLSCFTSKLHVLISETLAARGSIWKFE